MTDIRKKIAGKTSKLAQDRPKQADHPANLNDYQPGSFYHIDIQLIIPDPTQPEKHFAREALQELAQSIKQSGLYQPILVRKDEAGEIILVAGYRRLKAAKIAGIKQIPAIFTEGNPLEVSLIENLQRENLKTIEEAEYLDCMIKQHGYTEEELAAVLGKTRPAISEIIKINHLPQTIKDECRQNDQYPRGLLMEVARQETPEAMLILFNRIKEGKTKSTEDRPPDGKYTPITERVQAPAAMDGDIYSRVTLPGTAGETVEQRRKNELVAELQNLIRIIDEQIT